MTKILKLINHDLTEEQTKDLFKLIPDMQLLELPTDLKKWTTQSPDSPNGINFAVGEIIGFIDQNKVDVVLLPAGSPAFMFVFAHRIKQDLPFVKCLFSHSVREFQETKRDDGSVKKINIFKHKKWMIL